MRESCWPCWKTRGTNRAWQGRRIGERRKGSDDGPLLRAMLSCEPAASREGAAHARRQLALALPFESNRTWQIDIAPPSQPLALRFDSQLIRAACSCFSCDLNAILLLSASALPVCSVSPCLCECGGRCGLSVRVLVS